MSDISHSSIGIAYVPISCRELQLSKTEWWSMSEVDARDGADIMVGAATLLHRSMRELSWNREYAMRAIKAYRQFFELKKVLEDWDGKIVVASSAVEQLWKLHMMDPINYCHDCVLLCGRVVGNDPEDKLDGWAHQKRVLATKQLLRARYENEVDDEIWSVLPSEMRQDSEVECFTRSSAPERRSSPVHDMTMEVKKDEHVRIDSTGAESVSSAYSNYQQSYRSGKTNLTAKTLPSKTKEHASQLITEEAEMIKTDVSGKQVPFQVRIRTLKGQVYHLSVNQETTIEKIKSMIEEGYGTPKEQQHLLFYGKVLEDWKTLREHNIPPNAGLQLLARSKRTADPTHQSQSEQLTA